MFCQRTSNNHNIIHRTGNFETLDVLAEGIHTHSGSRTWGAGRTLQCVLIWFFVCLIHLWNIRTDFLSGWCQSYVKEKEMVFYLEYQNVWDSYLWIRATFVFVILSNLKGKKILLPAHRHFCRRSCQLQHSCTLCSSSALLRSDKIIGR